MPTAPATRHARLDQATLLLLAGLATTAAADTILVPQQVPTIQAAIEAAHPGDRVLVSAGQWTGPIDLLGKAIVLESVDGPAATVLDGLGQLGFVVVASGVDGGTAEIRGFTITGGVGEPGSLGGGPGGGVLVEGGSVRLLDCVVVGNSGISGGGVAAVGASLVIEGSRLEANHALIGGGLAVEGGSIALSDTVFDSNSAVSFGGGAAFLGADVVVADSRFSGNVAGSFGGGVYANASSLSIARVAIVDNGRTIASEGGSFSTHPIGGGGLYTTASTGRIEASRILRNQGAFGAGAYFAGSGSVALVNALVAENGRVCDCAIGAIYANGSSPAIVNSTIVENGGFVGVFTTFGAFPTVANSIVAGAVDGSVPQQSFGGNGVASVRYSLLQGILFAADAGPGTAFLASAVGLDPANDYAPLAGSPAIDAGDNGALPADVATDLLGLARFIDDPNTPDTGVGKGPIVDIGAIEFSGGAPQSVVGDMDGDGLVGPSDLAMLLAAWGPCGGCVADLTGDGVVDGADLLVMLAHWGGSKGG